MDKKSKTALEVIKTVYEGLPDITEFIDNQYSEAWYKENVSLEEVYFIINNSC